MNRPLGTLAAAAAGALAMYYLDPELGARRRALLAQLVRRPVHRAYLRQPAADAQTDAELRARIQERLGRMLSHPGAIDVSVEDGVVRLSGHVLVKERDGLLEQVQQMPGVQKLVNAMTAHDFPQEIASRTPPVPEAATNG